MSDFKKIHEELLKPCDYKYRVQSIQYGKVSIVAYIDARQLQDRLDEVVGADKWQVKYEEKKGNLFAGIGIKVSDEWVWKFDCGTESNVEKEKGEASDSFKRAGVMWGVGRFLYSLPLLKLNTKKYTPQGSNKEKEYPCDDKGNILWTAEEVNSYCHKLAKSQNVNRDIPKQPEPVKEVEMKDTQFNSALERINKGEQGIVKNIKDHNLPISKDQLTILETAEKNYKPKS